MTIPTRASLRRALSWATEQEAFIARELARMPERLPFASGQVLPVLGHDRTIKSGDVKRDAVENDLIRLRSGSDAAVHRRCETLLRRAVLAAAEEDLHDLWGLLGVSQAPVSVRAYRRRWGTCRSDGATALNWRLVFAPRFVLRHVCAHEAAHRLHMDHGPGFRATLRRLDPDVVAAREWLRREGMTLYRYGASP